MRKTKKGATASRRAVWRPPLPVIARANFGALFLNLKTGLECAGKVNLKTVIGFCARRGSASGSKRGHLARETNALDYARDFRGHDARAPRKSLAFSNSKNGF